MDEAFLKGLKPLKIPISVEYSLDTDVEIFPATMLGPDGMFVETTVVYPPGINVVVRFYIPEFDKVIEVVGEVVEVVSDGIEETNFVPGIFLRFKAIEKDDLNYLKNFVEKV